MGDEDAKAGRGFTVVDKRGGGGDPPERAASAAEGGEAAAGGPLPSIDFSTFTLSMAASALYHMGLVEDPESGEKPEPNLVLARQTIDTLEMLQAKTTGNLEDEESKLIESLLYDLHMRFVEISK